MDLRVFDNFFRLWNQLLPESPTDSIFCVGGCWLNHAKTPFFAAYIPMFAGWVHISISNSMDHFQFLLDTFWSLLDTFHVFDWFLFLPDQFHCSLDKFWIFAVPHQLVNHVRRTHQDATSFPVDAMQRRTFARPCGPGTFVHGIRVYATMYTCSIHIWSRPASGNPPSPPMLPPPAPPATTPMGVTSRLPPSVKISYAHMLYLHAGLVPPMHYITEYLHAVFTTA